MTTIARRWTYSAANTQLPCTGCKGPTSGRVEVARNTYEPQCENCWLEELGEGRSRMRDFLIGWAACAVSTGLGFLLGRAS